MKRLSLVLAVGLVGVVPGLLMARGPQGMSQYSGRDDYRVFCANCHGAAAKGDGAMARTLRKRPPDLTQLTKKHDGVYPVESIVKIVKEGHEQESMPAWGDVFAKSQESDGPAAAQERIKEIVAYLGTLQEKP